MANFEKALNFVLENEGGYINSPLDKGGETKYGISKSAYPNLDIFNLTLKEASNIYLNDYWLSNNLQNIQNENLSITLLDFIVNTGKAQRIIQQTVNELGGELKIDGIIGPLTIGALNALDANKLGIAINANRLAYLKSLSSWANFGKGWTKRVKRNLELFEKNSPLIIILLACIFYLVKH